MREYSARITDIRILCCKWLCRQELGCTLRVNVTSTFKSYQNVVIISVSNVEEKRRQLNQNSKDAINWKDSKPNEYLVVLQFWSGFNKIVPRLYCQESEMRWFGLPPPIFFVFVLILVKYSNKIESNNNNNFYCYCFYFLSVILREEKLGNKYRTHPRFYDHYDCVEWKKKL